MPGLHAFNRRWAIGTDDFVFPGLLEIFLRVVWLIAISVVYNLHQDSFWECEGGTLLRTYYIGLLVLLCICIVLCSIIVLISMQGSITNTAPRKKLVKFLYVKMAISVPELAWNALGTYWSFVLSSGCERFVVVIVKGAVLCGWILAVIVIVGVIIVFDPLGNYSSQKHDKGEGRQSGENQQLVDGYQMARLKAWYKRVRCLCCCIQGDEQNKSAFDEISKLFSDFFDVEGIDLIPTDIAAGLILVQQMQDKGLTSAILEKTYNTFNSSTSSTSKSTIPGSLQNGRCSVDVLPEYVEPKPWMNIKLMTHYLKFAIGSYGWPLFLFAHFPTGSCRLLGSCKCCACYLGNNVYDDNCCQCNTAAIKRNTRLHEDDIIYVSFHNTIYEVPFYVAIDRETQSVVVAIRGSLSLHDAITDLTAESDVLDMEGLDNCVAHKGILQAAQFVKAELEKKCLLQTAFERAQGGRLVITGHSLGAGTAALLSMLMKAEYPDLICFAYAPPGGLMSKCASQYSQDFICSVVLGKDLVTRLGIVSMEDLKAKTLQMISQSQTPKYKILVSGAWQLLCGCCCEGNNDNSLGQLIGTQKNMEEAVHTTMLAREHHIITRVQLYPPGQILHVQEVDTDRSCWERASHYAEWRPAEDFSDVIVSPDMVSDHMPDKLYRALKQLSEKNFNPRAPKHNNSAVATTEV